MNSTTIHHATPCNTNIEYDWIWKQLRNREKCWPENYLTGSSLPMCQRSHCGICGTRSLHWCHCSAQQTLLPRVAELHSHKQSNRTVCICMSNDQPESIAALSCAARFQRRSEAFALYFRWASQKETQHHSCKTMWWEDASVKGRRDAL